ncbi:HepT-like ribonuclease domain-containing protein [Pseudonocardia phyllosphaerae]|uniref:HepT-like ribonuclease domain-containing protein n=1 Tax=Pseudonocardia phyllosphaerae TaxID=3390502 RepID=UPI003978DCB3
MRSDADRAQDIVDAIVRIQRYTNMGRDEFDDNELIQVWVVQHLQIVGEAAAKMSADTRECYPDVPWKKIIGMRNVLVHGYFSIDRDLVWGVVDRELGPLLGTAQNMVTELS